MELRERDCYWKLEGIRFETIQEKILPWIYANKAPKRTIGKSHPCLFCMILFTDFTGTFKSSYRVGKKFPFRYFIQLIMFEITVTYFLKAHAHNVYV